MGLFDHVPADALQRGQERFALPIRAAERSAEIDDLEVAIVLSGGSQQGGDDRIAEVGSVEQHRIALEGSPSGDDLARGTRHGVDDQFGRVTLGTAGRLRPVT